MKTFFVSKYMNASKSVENSGTSRAALELGRHSPRGSADDALVAAEPKVVGVPGVRALLPVRSGLAVAVSPVRAHAPGKPLRRRPSCVLHCAVAPPHTGSSSRPPTTIPAFRCDLPQVTSDRKSSPKASFTKANRFAPGYK